MVDAVGEPPQLRSLALDWLGCAIAGEHDWKGVQDQHQSNHG